MESERWNEGRPEIQSCSLFFADRQTTCSHARAQRSGKTTIPSFFATSLPLCFLFFIALTRAACDLRGGGSILQIKIPGKLLRFANSSTFKIALFADLHFGENAWTDWGPLQDINSQAVMSTVLDREKPDFVIYLGDVITANNIAIQNASQYWDQAIAPTRERGIPWASVFGNHDDMPFVWPSEWFSSSGIPEIQCSASNASLTYGNTCYFKGTTRKELSEKEIQNFLSVTSKGPSYLWPSVSNYVLQISSSKDEEEPIAHLYFLDSGGGSYPEVISSAQTRWFQEESERLNRDGRVPEVIFWHIPSTAFKSVAPLLGIHKPCVGSINKERVAAQEAEWGMMDALIARKSAKAVFVGHNHGLDWCCPYKKLWLCFARHTGYGGYGNWARGARILELHEHPFSLKSWIRMENGVVHGQVTLVP